MSNGEKDFSFRRDESANRGSVQDWEKIIMEAWKTEINKMREVDRG